jgi:hypothetical protein
VFIRVFPAKTAANTRRFLRDLKCACPLRIRTILTPSHRFQENDCRAIDNMEFTDRLFSLRKRAATGAHEFDTLCAALEIEHRLTPPKSPQTNGIPLGDFKQSPAGRRVERFNGRIEEVLRSPLPIWRRAGNHAVPLRLALQPATPAIRLGQQVTLAGDEGLEHTQARAVQETVILPSGM